MLRHGIDPQFIRAIATMPDWRLFNPTGLWITAKGVDTKIVHPYNADIDGGAANEQRMRSLLRLLTEG